MQALVIFSGGQDSTTCLALAKQQFSHVHTLSFEYGQRHSIELESAQRVADLLGVASHVVVSLGALLSGDSPLVGNRPVAEYESVDDLPGGLEDTFVPGRNILFLTVAATRAYILGIHDIFIGVCEEDFGGYWDCRGTFVQAMQAALGEGMYGDAGKYRLHAPLLQMSKAEVARRAYNALGAQQFKEVFAQTHTCYQGVRGGCGKCHACHLRDRGFQEAGIEDPLWKFRKHGVGV